MENKERDVRHSPVLNKVLTMLDDLKVSPAGAIIHGHIEQMLSEMSNDHHKTEDAYARFLDMLMEACISLIPVESPLHTHMRLLQMRLTPPLSVSELGVLNRAVEVVADELVQSGSFRGRDLIPALSPVIERFGGPVQPSNNARENTALDSARVQDASIEEPADLQNTHNRTSPVSARSESITDLRVNSAYRAHLDEKRGEMQKLQQDFIAQMGSAVEESEAFGILLKDALASLQQAESTEELEVHRLDLIQVIDGLTEGHLALGEKFASAQDYLTILEDDNQQLSDELDRVRLLSLTDELTRLPNRRAFMRRLEDEVSRVKRHGYPLGLVLMDLDHFKRINDLRGHAAGDDVLRCYADEVLSIFRHHDLVARYGGEEFAVLMPNTTIDGVICALVKVRSRLGEVIKACQADDIIMPTFSAGIAQFHPGETPSSLIERADTALYSAKRAGRDRTVVYGENHEDETLNQNPLGA